MGRSGQWRLFAVESARRPCDGIMTDRTIKWEILGNMIGIANVIVVAGVATVTVSRGGRILSVSVAFAACYRSMCASQRECGGTMIECGWTPGKYCVACGAVVAESSHHMIWIGGTVEVTGMACIAFGGYCPQVAVVARGTIGNRMTSLQRESGGMLKRRICPSR